MKRYVYNRVSSDAQDYQQQMECIRQYFERQGIDPSCISETVVETVSGTVGYEERKLSELIDRCEPGDIIYVSELSRLSRSMADLFALVNKCCNKGKEEARRGEKSPVGITLIQCKDGAVIENESIAGKAILFALGLAAEIEVTNTRQRTRMALAARMEEARVNGFWISKAGNVCTRIGAEKGVDMSVQKAASDESKRAAAAEWLRTSPAFKFVRRKTLEGVSAKEIHAEITAMERDCPGTYLTREGRPVSLWHVYSWRSSILDAEGLVRKVTPEYSEGWQRIIEKSKKLRKPCHTRQSTTTAYLRAYRK